MKLSEQLQRAFSDIQISSTKQQEAISAQRILQQQFDELKMSHQIELQTYQRTSETEITLLKVGFLIHRFQLLNSWE